MALCTLVHERGHAVNWFVYVVLDQAGIVCDSLSLLILNFVWMSLGNQLHCSFNVLSNGPVLYHLYVLEMVMLH